MPALQRASSFHSTFTFPNKVGSQTQTDGENYLEKKKVSYRFILQGRLNVNQINFIHISS